MYSISVHFTTAAAADGAVKPSACPCLLHAACCLPHACRTPCMGASDFVRLTLVRHLSPLTIGIVGTVGLGAQGDECAMSYDEFILKCNFRLVQINFDIGAT